MCVCCVISERLQESSLQLCSHGLCRVSILLLNEFESQEDLNFQFDWELIIDDSDQGTTNFNDFFFDCCWLWELEQVFECKGSVDPNLDRSVHDGSLDIVDHWLDTCNLLQNHKLLAFLFVKVLDDIAFFSLNGVQRVDNLNCIDFKLSSDLGN